MKKALRASYFDSRITHLLLSRCHPCLCCFNPRCCNGSRWLFNFRRPSICQSSASPRVLRLLSLRCRFVPSKFCFGLHSAWSNHLCIDFFYAAPCPPSCKVNLQVYECILYCVQVLLPNKNAYAIKKHRNPLELHKASAPELSGTLPSTCTGTLRNLTGYLHRYLHRNPPEPSGTLPGTWCWSCTGSHQS